MKAKSIASANGCLCLLFTVLLFILNSPLQLQAQTQDSRSGDEAALEALYVAANGSSWNNNGGWSSSGMSLGNSIHGVSTATVDGELRVTAINLKNNNLTGSIDVPELGNLKQMTLFAVTFNSLNSSLPPELGNAANLEYLYLSRSDDVYVKNEFPHDTEEVTGGGDVHPGKNKGSENNVFTGPVPPEWGNLEKLKWLILNWTDSSSSSFDGITSVPDEIFNITTFEGLQIYENSNVSPRPFPSGVADMSGLVHLALGIQKTGGEGWVTGSLPAGFGNLSNLKFLRLKDNPNLTIDFDVVDFSGLKSLRNLVLAFTDIRGSFPDELLDGTLNDKLVGINLSFPEASGMTGSLPSGSTKMQILNVNNNNLSGAIPAEIWKNTQLINTNFSNNSFTSIGTDDLTGLSSGYWQIRNLRWSNNDIKGRWPNLDWENPDATKDFRRFEVENNRYVFSDMLWIPDNGGGKTIFELYKSQGLSVFSYSPQKPFGRSRTINFTTGSNVTINDFDDVVTHKDNRYQWKKNGSNISGATSRSLAISNAQDSDAGTYTLVVTNPNISALTLTSEPIELQVGSGGSDSPPSAPSLTSPVDGATGISTSPTLDWNSVSGADSYRLQVAASSDFSSTVTDASGLTGTQYEVSGLDYNTGYYWRVRASNSEGSGDWSSVWSFATESEPVSPPDTPVLRSPSDGATGITTTPTLDWDAADRADSYRVLVSEDDTFSETVIDLDGISASTTSYQPDGLDYATTYYWKVVAENSGGSTSSDAWSFTTEDPALDQPQLADPADGATDQPTTLALSWNAVSDADTYRLQVATDESFQSLFDDQGNISATEFTVENLDNGSTYYWRVRASNADGNSNWSQVRSFTTVAGDSSDPMAAPSLEAPSDGASGVSLTPTLSWSDVGADYYILHLDSPETPDLILEAEPGGTQYEVTSPLAGERLHKWRVRGVKDGVEGEWSSIFEFTTGSGDGSLPAAPTLSAPSDGATDQPTTSTLDWNSVSSADTYRVQLATTSDFSSPVTDVSGLTATQYEVSGLDYSTGYYWRVRASNSEGSGNWSSEWSFTTEEEPPSPPGTATLISPEDGVTGVTTSPIFEWEAASDADSYRLLISTDESFASLQADTAGITTTTLQVEGLDNATTYWWKVIAVNNAGETESETQSFTTEDTSLDQPQLVDPDDGATEQPTTLVLSWNAVDRADTYRLQLGSEEAFQTVEVDQSDITATEFTAENLNSGTTYYWRVRASNADGSSSWSEIRSFTTAYQVPDIPNLSSPNDGAVDQPTTLTLQWDASERAESYVLQVSADQEFLSLEFEQNGITGTEQEVKNVSNATTYYWRVRAVNPAGGSNWSGVWTFTTASKGNNGNGPNPPGQSKPDDKEENVPRNPNFEWSSVDADYYTLEVSMVSTGEVILEEDVYDTIFTPQQDLAYNTDYQWRIKGVKDSVDGAWSELWTFTTEAEGDGEITDPPAVPVLTTPADGAENTSLLPTFTWEPVDADNYVLQVTDGETFETVVETVVTGTIYTPSEELAYQTDYRWRVRAVKEGVEGDWSTERQFITEPEDGMETSLEQNYPNPFNPSTQVRFTLAETQRVSLKVYDTTGRQVATIVEGTLQAGTYERTFQADNLASGIYFLRLVTDNQVATSQMTLLK